MGLGASLAARILVFDGTQWITNAPVGPGQHLIVRVPPPVEVDGWYAYAIANTLDLKFPYGIEVDPDVPV